MIKKIFSVGLISLFTFFAMGMNTAVLSAQLQENTPVLIQLDKAVTQDSVVQGDIVTFHVLNNVIDSNNNVVISQNTPVYGKVTKLQRQGRIGISGKIIIDELYTNTVKGTPVFLNGTVSDLPKNKMKSTIAWSVILCGLFMLRKGDKASLPEGYQSTVYTKDAIKL